MRVQDVLKRKGHDVVTISPAASVGDLLKLLNEHRIGSVVVMDGDRMVGIVSERDILSRLAASDDDDIRTVPVHEVMSQTRVCSLDDDTAELAAVMTEFRVRHLPVVDADGRHAYVSRTQLCASRDSRPSSSRPSCLSNV